MKNIFLIVGLLLLSIIVNAQTYYNSNYTGAEKDAAILKARDSMLVKGNYSINVLDLGAVGDSTTDNVDAIQGAIDLAVSTGRAIYIPAGIYLCDTSLSIQANYIRIFGDGKENSKIHFTGTYNGIVVGSGTNYVNGVRPLMIEGLTFEGEAGTLSGIMLQNASEVYMNNCAIQHFGRNGVDQGIDTWTNTFINCSFFSNDSSGFAVKGQFNLNRFFGCVFNENSVAGFLVDSSPGAAWTVGFYSCAFEGNPYGIFTESTLKNWEIRNCWFEANTTNDIKGDQIVASQITNNYFGSGIPNNILFADVNYGTIIESNQAVSCTDASISVTSSVGYGSSINNNRFGFHHVKVGSTYYDDYYYGELEGGHSMRGTSWFTATDEVDTVTISGASTGDNYILTPKIASTGSFNANDMIYCIPTSTGFMAKRNAAGTSELEYDWLRISNHLGAELLSNGSFDDSTGWTPDNPWVIDNGVATFTAAESNGELRQDISFTVGYTYQVSFEVNAATGTATFGFFDGTAAVAYIDYITVSNGRHKFNFVYSGGTGFKILASRFYSSFTLDHLSVRRLLY